MDSLNGLPAREHSESVDDDFDRVAPDTFQLGDSSMTLRERCSNSSARILHSRLYVVVIIATLVLSFVSLVWTLAKSLPTTAAFLVLELFILGVITFEVSVGWSAAGTKVPRGEECQAPPFRIL